MATDNKLAALITSYDAVEKNALLELRRVERIADDRWQIVEELRKRYLELTTQLDRLAGEDTRGALLAGDMARLSSVRGYKRRLKRVFERIGRELVEKEADWNRAVERVKFAEQDLVEARIEKKKVEQLSANRKQYAQTLEIARGEVVSEDLQRFRERE